MENQYLIRLAEPADSKAILKIYGYYVLSSAISFEYDVPDVEEYSERIRKNNESYPWLVCLRNDEIIGFVYAGTHRYRTAYQWSVESAVYVDSAFHGKGIARVLYESLFSILQLQGFVNVYAGVAMPNEKSEKFHRIFGFEEIGVFKNIGYKFGKWHDVKWFQYFLKNHSENPAPPQLMHQIPHSPEFQNIVRLANELCNGRC